MVTLSKRLRTPLVSSLCMSLVVWFGIMVLRNTGHLEALELAAYDWYIRLRPQHPVPESRIVLVGITESDIHAQGWPLSDATLAQLLAQLAAYKPRAIGVDIYRDVTVPPGQDELNAVLRTHSHIVMPTKLGDNGERGIAPPAILMGTEQVGFVDILVDPGGTVRRGLLFLRSNEGTAYAFALRLALLYLQGEGMAPQPDPDNPQYVRLGHTTITPFQANDGGYVGADARGYQFLLDFRNMRDAFPTLALTPLLAGEVDLGIIKDKIVLVGVTAESVKDLFYTSHSLGRRAGQQMSGMVLHAHIVSQLLRSALEGMDPMRTASDLYEWGWILVWSVLGGVVSLWLASAWRFAIAAASALVLVGGSTYIAFLYGWWIPVVPPAAAWMLSAAVVIAYITNQETKQRKLLMQLFARHLSPEVVDTIWRQRDEFLHDGRPRPQRMIASVMFTDLVGFTTVSEKMEPQELVDWLDEYMEAMTPHVIGHHGVLLRFTGDGMLAAFGVPLARSTEAEIRLDAVRAVQAALDMRRELVQRNRIWREQQRPMIGMRVGILTGPVVAGSVGGRHRLEYNIHGDTVNTASRLENFEPHTFIPDFDRHPCRILMGEPTLRYVEGQFQTQRIGTVDLKGKAQKVTVYRVVDAEEHRIHRAAEEKES
jgi:adenylate cyclase